MPKLKTNWLISGILLWGAIAYFNTLNNNFLILDDVNGIVRNTSLKDFIQSMSTFHLQTITNSLIINLFGLNSTAFHGVSVILHLTNTFLLYLLFKLFFGERTALLTSWLFVVHPINTEAVNWISANNYLLRSILSLGLLLAYFRETKNSPLSNRIVLKILIWFGLIVLLIRNFWVVTIPVAIILFDWMIGKSLVTKRKLSLILGMIIILGYYYLLSGSAYYNRWSDRSQQNFLPMNQQSLIPVWESWPYSIYAMTKNYVWPMDLMIYYDSNPIDIYTYWLMYIVSGAYLLVGLWFWWKGNKKITALMWLPAVLIAPVLNPWGLSWYMAERYLYMGTAAWCALLVFMFFSLERLFKIKNMVVILSLGIVVVYSGLTIIRNNAWQNSETLAMATLTTSPKSMRAYQDLGNYYLLQGKYRDAAKAYQNGLKIYPFSSTSIKNLGLIWLNQGISPADAKKLLRLNDAFSVNEVKNAAAEAFLSQNYSRSLFYYSQLVHTDTEYPLVVERISKIYHENKKWEFAIGWLDEWKNLDPDSAEIYYLLADAYKESGDQEKAASNISTAIDKDNTNSKYIDLADEIRISK